MEKDKFNGLMKCICLIVIFISSLLGAFEFGNYLCNIFNLENSSFVCFLIIIFVLFCFISNFEFDEKEKDIEKENNAKLIYFINGINKFNYTDLKVIKNISLSPFGLKFQFINDYYSTIELENIKINTYHSDKMLLNLDNYLSKNYDFKTITETLDEKTKQFIISQESTHIEKLIINFIRQKN